MRVTPEDIENKDMSKANRMERSETARQRRKETKQMRETRLMNEYAKKRREKKN
jgi:hypothetical protein